MCATQSFARFLYNAYVAMWGKPFEMLTKIMEPSQHTENMVDTHGNEVKSEDDWGKPARDFTPDEVIFILTHQTLVDCGNCVVREDTDVCFSGVGGQVRQGSQDHQFPHDEVRCTPPQSH